MKNILLAVTFSAFALPVLADTTVNGKLSTLGLGAEVAFPVSSSVDARIGLNSYKYNFNNTTTSSGNSTDFRGDLKLQSLQALADWHPWSGSFRLSGGLMYNNNKFDMTAQPVGGSVNIGGVPYAVSGSEYVNATVDFNKLVPYLGMGWGRTPRNTGLSFTSDIGVMFQGSPKGSVTTNISGVAASDINQANADLNDGLKNFKIYPVLSFGIGYTF